MVDDGRKVEVCGDDEYKHTRAVEQTQRTTQSIAK